MILIGGYLTDPKEIRVEIENSALKVANYFGAGFNELIYHKAMEIELKRRNVQFDSHRVVPIFYEEHCIGQGEADLVIMDGFGRPMHVIELKAVASSDEKVAHCRQLEAYMRGFPTVVGGFVINFQQPTNWEFAPLIQWFYYPRPEFESKCDSDNKEQQQPKSEC